MQRRYIMTAFGKDRPGIVAEVSKILYENGCNLEDSSMTRLVDEFVIILLFTSGDPDIEGKLNAECRRIEIERGISAFFRSVDVKYIKREEDFTPADLHVEGVDQVGIVYTIAKTISSKGININNLKSRRKLSPESGSAYYEMDIELQIPVEVNLEDVEKELNAVAEDLNVEIEFKVQKGQ